MLRVILLLLYLIASYSAVQVKEGGGCDPNGQMCKPPPAGGLTGNLDPNG